MFLPVHRIMKKKSLICYKNTSDTIDRLDLDLPYNLVFIEETHDVIPLPMPALFDHVARNGYRIMPKDIVAY